MASDLEKRVTAKIVLDDSGFNRTLKGVNAGIKESKSEFKAASEGLKTYGKNTEQLKNAQQALTRQLEQQAKKVDLYKQSLEKTSNKMKENIKERDRLKHSLESTNKAYDKVIKSQSKGLEAYRKNETALEKLNKKYSEAKKSYGENAQETKKLKEQISKLESEQKKLVASNEEEIKSYQKVKSELNSTKDAYEKKSRAVESNAKSIQSNTTQLNNANAEMVRTQGQLDHINRNISDNSNHWKTSSKRLKEHSENLDKVGGAVSDTGDKLLLMNAPLLAVGGAAVKVSSDFEAGMSEVQAISGATGEDLEKLKEKAKEMGAKTKFSASESAEALKYMAMAGWKTNDMLDGLSGIMNLAAASGENLGTTSDIVTDALTAFGLQAKDSGHFSDILASASSNANTNVSMLGESFKYCAPVCGAMGMSASDTAVALGLMANAGIKGSTAGTVLRTTLTNLAKPTDTVYSAMKKLNLSLTDSHGKVKPLSTLMEELRQKMGGLDKATQAEMAACLAGKEAMSGLLAIVNASPADYDKLTSSIKNCDGISQKMSDTMNNNLNGQWTLLKSQLEGVGIQLGQTLLPLAKKGLDIVSKWVDWFSKLSPEMQETIVKTVLFGTAAGGTLKVVGSGISTVATITSGISKLTGILGSASTAAEVATTASTGLTAAAEGVGAASGVAATGAVAAEGGIAALGTTIGAVLLPATLIVGAIAAISYGAYKLYQHMNEEATPAVDLFADKVDESTERIVHANGRVEVKTKKTVTEISENTKKAVGAYIDLDKKASNAMMDLKVNTDVLSGDAKKSLLKNFQDMSKQATGYSDEYKTKVTTNFKNVLDGTSHLTMDQKNKILKNYMVMVNGCDKLSTMQKSNMIANFRDQLNQSVGITKQQSQELQKIYKDMGDKIQSGLDKKKAEELKTINDFFVKSSVLTEQEKQDIIKKTDEGWSNKKKTIDDYEKQINDIMNKAVEEHRELNQDECNSINDIQQKMKDNAVKTLSENEVESNVILERIKANDEHITAEQASEHIKKLNEIRDNAVKAANEECDKRIAEIIRMRDESKVISADQADNLIAEANRQKNDTIKAAEETRNNSVDKISSMNSDIKSSVNTTTGDVLTNWDKLCNWWDNWHPIKKILEVFTKHTSDGKSADSNWTGTSYFKGGLTTLHERGEELYDLPRGTRIYNHEMSERMVLETAKQAAQGVISEMMKNNSSNDGNIIIPISIAGEEIDRVVTPRVSNRLAMSSRGRRG